MVYGFSGSVPWTLVSPVLLCCTAVQILSSVKWKRIEQDINSKKLATSREQKTQLKSNALLHWREDQQDPGLQNGHSVMKTQVSVAHRAVSPWTSSRKHYRACWARNYKLPRNHRRFSASSIARYLKKMRYISAGFGPERKSIIIWLMGIAFIFCKHSCTWEHSPRCYNNKQ